MQIYRDLTITNHFKKASILTIWVIKTLEAVLLKIIKLLMRFLVNIAKWTEILCKQVMEGLQAAKLELVQCRCSHQIIEPQA